MSTSLLYHGFGIRGHQYVKTAYEAGRVTFTVLQERGNPFASIKERRMTVDPPKYVSAGDFHKVLAVCSTAWWKTFLTLAYTSGGRRDELLNLTWKDVDFEKQTIGFRPKRATESNLAWQPKDRESRVVPIPAVTVQLLANLQIESGDGNPYIFINEARLKHILTRRSQGTWEPDCELVNNICRSIEVLCCKAQIGLFTPHDLRRSCITNWAQRLPIQTVQYLAGHSDITTTRKYYSSVQTSDLAIAREIQSDLLAQLTNF